MTLTLFSQNFQNFDIENKKKTALGEEKKKNEGRTEDIKNLELYHKLIAILTRVSCF